MSSVELTNFLYMEFPTSFIVVSVLLFGPNIHSYIYYISSLVIFLGAISVYPDIINLLISLYVHILYMYICIYIYARM